MTEESLLHQYLSNPDNSNDIQEIEKYLRKHKTMSQQPTEFDVQYSKLCDYYKVNQDLPASVLYEIEDYLNLFLTLEQIKEAVYLAIMTCSQMPTPKQLVELVHGTPQQNAYRQWGRIMDRWESVKGNQRISKNWSFLHEDKFIDSCAFTTLTVLGFLRLDQWDVIYDFRQEFVKTYTILKEGDLRKTN